MKTAKKKLIENVKEYVNHWSREDLTVERNDPGSGKRSQVTMVMMRTVTKVWTLPTKRKKFITVDEGWLRTCVTGSLESKNDCYIGEDVAESIIELLEVRTKEYRVCERVK